MYNMNYKLIFNFCNRTFKSNWRGFSLKMDKWVTLIFCAVVTLLYLGANKLTGPNPAEQLKSLGGHFLKMYRALNSIGLIIYALNYGTAALGLTGSLGLVVLILKITLSIGIFWLYTKIVVPSFKTVLFEGRGVKISLRYWGMKLKVKPW